MSLKTQSWSAQKAFKKWNISNANFSKEASMLSSLQPIYLYAEDEEIPISELEVTLLRAAQIVEYLGPNYIEVFERAERELDSAKSKINTLERIRNLTIPSKPSYLSGNLIEP